MELEKTLPYELVLLIETAQELLNQKSEANLTQLIYHQIMIKYKVSLV